MLTTKVNLQKELENIRKQNPIEEANSIIQEGSKEDMEILNTIAPHSKTNTKVIRSRENIDMKDVYHLDEIKQLAIKYRLRFLEAHRFKGEMPLEAIHKLKRVSDTTDSHTLRCNTYILAPKSQFKLEPKNVDPVMFYRVKGDYYKFVHKWGIDMSILRAVLCWPMRNFTNFLIIWIATLAYILKLYIPIISSYSSENTPAAVGLPFILFMLGFLALIIIGGVNWNVEFFSKNIWQNSTE